MIQSENKKALSLFSRILIGLLVTKSGHSPEHEINFICTTFGITATATRLPLQFSIEEFTPEAFSRFAVEQYYEIPSFIALCLSMQMQATPHNNTN